MVFLSTVLGIVSKAIAPAVDKVASYIPPIATKIGTALTSATKFLVSTTPKDVAVKTTLAFAPEITASVVQPAARAAGYTQQSITVPFTNITATKPEIISSAMSVGGGTITLGKEVAKQYVGGLTAGLTPQELQWKKEGEELAKRRAIDAAKGKVAEVKEKVAEKKFLVDGHELNRDQVADYGKFYFSQKTDKLKPDMMNSFSFVLPSLVLPSFPSLSSFIPSLPAPALAKAGSIASIAGLAAVAAPTIIKAVLKKKAKKKAKKKPKKKSRRR